ncbi:hypothetical protein AOQ84DRAFT_387564 [Glonium stellatum]|uniref:Uncharacterized protein n=1 Tax=Glonium stellatum TaxID=574774 RepID=A0A8E2JV59_9PEZI|nr:hypothetical protein AOQ84DRAFT_387564 [Glonium stellatum]
MSRLVKLVGTGIGLATEAYHARNSPSPSPSPAITASSAASSSRAPPTYVDAPPQYAELPVGEADELIARGQAVPAEKEKAYMNDGSDISDSDEERDEQAWELDEAAEEADPPSYAEITQQEANDELARALGRLPPPNPSQRLPCPVIIPQRRPKNKARGFVRAYAPVLEGCGIDQATFLTFLKSFHQSSKASPILDVIFVGAAIAGFAPSVAAMIASTVVQVAAGTAKEIQSRKRSNSFLDDMNQRLFMPRGLYCLIMSFKPESARPISGAQVNINDTIAKYTQHAQSGYKNTIAGLRVSSGKTYGEFELPESAPLVFPGLDQAVADPNASKFKKSQKFVADYLDRRAQATYANENPNSSLTTASTPQFASRFSDPNHPANSGSLISLVTGGALGGRKQRRQGGRGGLGDLANEFGRRQRRQRGRRGERGGAIKSVRKMMQQDVLYLMVVNLPTDRELEIARSTLQAQGAA